MAEYRSSWLAQAPIDDYFATDVGRTTHDFVDQDDLYHTTAGTPTVGIYAQDGLWDEEDSELSIGTGNGTSRYSSALSGPASSIKTKGGSMKSRSRSGTASPFPVEQEEKAGMWAWTRRAKDSPASIAERSSEVAKGLSKKESKARLRGKGRRGELIVVVDPEQDFGSPPPVPPTLASYLETPVTASPAFFSPQQHLSRHDENTPPTAGKGKGNWKKGMQRIFRSKSSAALREISNSNTPPVPLLPTGQKVPLGKPFSTSTPPAATVKPTRRFSILSLRTVDDAAPTKKGAEPVGLFQNFPADPFESSLDVGSKGMRAEEVPPPRMPRHSPSLKSLKEFMSPKPKLKLAKTKSMANIKGPLSAPPGRTEFPPVPQPPRRIASVSSFRGANGEASPSRATMTATIPVESPPLLPPNPPYFPFEAIPAQIAGPTDQHSRPLSLSASAPATPLPPAPSTPLPALPGPTTQPLASGDMPRSGSSYKLLPRSRSTSMSLRSPPTSSSFYDLYEQLGIWPTAEKDEQASLPAHISPNQHSAEDAALSNSPSVAFSSSSWEAAISAFPVLEDTAPRGQRPASELVESLSYVGCAGDRTIDSIPSNRAVAAHSPTSSQTHTIASSSGTAGPSRSRASQALRPTSSMRGRQKGAGGGSGASSREDSRERRTSTGRAGQWAEKWSSEEESESEEDDIPLSKLHPAAVAARQDKKAKAVERRDRRTRAKIHQIKLVGRNPGAETGWNGEGGVPAVALAERLERLSLPRPSPALSIPSDYPWGTSSRPRTREGTQPVSTHAGPSQVHLRSHTDPVRSTSQRTQPRPSAVMTTSPEMLLNDTRLPSPLPLPMRSSSTRSRDHTAPAAPRPSATLTRNASAASTYTQAPPRLPPPMPQDLALGGSLSRSNTSASKGSVSRSGRSRSNSTARHGMPSDENMIRANAAAEPMPNRATHIKAFIGSLEGKKVTMEVLPETTTRDVLAEAAKNGELAEAPRGMTWIIVELFAELGCERYIREYEQLQTVVRGWDATAKYNCLIIKQSHRGTSTLQTSIPQRAPFLGSWIQYESKRGKWSKRWLETRGGQVFLAKNEKNKDEVQINTLFFDVYHMTRPYPGPKPFIFVMKRMDPEASFENPEDFQHVFSAEEGVGFKLMSAIYDAKSFALQPHLLVRQGQVLRKPTLGSEDGPLVDIKKNVEEKTGFTGKGLLRL